MSRDERPFTLGEILQAHRVERLGPWTVKCHACDDWTVGTIHDHHADLAQAFFAAERDRAVAEALERAAVAMSGIGHHRDPCRLPDTECLCGLCDDRAAAAAVLRAALPAVDPEARENDRT